MNTSPLPTISAAALMDRDLPCCGEILAPLLASNGSALVYGPGGVGKSFFALGLAWAAASGGSFLGWRAPKPHRVQFVDGELGAVAMRERLALFGPPPPTLQLVLPDLIDGPAIDLAQPEGQYRLMESWGDPELVVLHTVSSLAALPRSEGGTTDALPRFLRHQRLSGRAMVLVDEATTKGPVRSTIRGLSALDTVIALRHPADWRPADGVRFEIHLEKTRRLVGEAAEPLLAQLLPAGPDGTAAWRWETITRDKLERAVRLLKRGLSAEAMGDALGISRAQAFRLQRQARQRGFVPMPGERGKQ
jgi:putative DNA primase/helicase